MDTAQRLEEEIKNIRNRSRNYSLNGNKWTIDVLEDLRDKVGHSIFALTDIEKEYRNMLFDAKAEMDLVISTYPYTSEPKMRHKYIKANPEEWESIVLLKKVAGDSQGPGYIQKYLRAANSLLENIRQRISVMRKERDYTHAESVIGSAIVTAFDKIENYSHKKLR